MLQGLAQHLPNHAQLLIDLRHHNPFELLGCHPVSADRVCVRAFVPNARSVKFNCITKPKRCRRRVSQDYFNGTEAAVLSLSITNWCVTITMANGIGLSILTASRL